MLIRGSTVNILNAKEIFSEWLTFSTLFQSYAMQIWNDQWTIGTCPYCQFNTLRQRQDDRHFADEIFQIRLLVWHLMYFNSSLTTDCPRFSIDNKPALVQIMAWRWTGNDGQIHWRIYPSPGLDELMPLIFVETPVCLVDAFAPAQLK